MVADDHGPEYVPWMAGAAKTLPVQYCGLGEPTTLLQRALHRAKQIAPAAQIIATVREENREYWEPALWFIRPEHCFVSDSRMTAPLATAAALLSIAADSFANVVSAHSESIAALAASGDYKPLVPWRESVNLAPPPSIRWRSTRRPQISSHGEARGANAV